MPYIFSVHSLIISKLKLSKKTLRFAHSLERFHLFQTVFNAIYKKKFSFILQYGFQKENSFKFNPKKKLKKKVKNKMQQRLSNIITRIRYFFYFILSFKITFSYIKYNMRLNSRSNDERKNFNIFYFFPIQNH